MKNTTVLKKAGSFILLCLFLVTVAGNAFAQERTITGVVIDDTGVPLPGVTIMIKGTSTGTQTGYDGDYSLPGVSPDDVLVFSFVGMATQEILVADQAVINVTMQTEAIGLEEVVAIGYGTQIRANLTGSVGRASAERLENRPIASVGHGLQGVIPNLNISIADGDPTTSANYNIRGFESITGGSPLILVDGVPMDLERINPNDIASVSVLRDAASAAVYGARAAFGVILVETKRGTGADRVNVQFSTEQSLSAPIYTVDPVHDPLVFAEWTNLARLRTRGTRRWDDNYMEGFANWVANPTEENAWGVYNDNIRYYGFNDYHNKLITDFSPQQQYNLNISGTTERTNYYASFGYLTKDGYLRNSEKNEFYDRYNILIRASYQVTDWLNLEPKIVMNIQDSDKPHFYNWDVNINTSVRVAPMMPLRFPDLPYYIEPGDRDQFEQYIGMHFGGTNFFPYLENGGRQQFTTNDTWLSQAVKLTPVDGLVINSDFSYRTYWRDYENVRSKIDIVSNNLRSVPMVSHGFSGNDWIDARRNYNQYYVFNTYAEYTLDQFDNHYVKAMVGYNQELGRNSEVRAQANELITPQVVALNATVGNMQTWGTKNHVALTGAFYRLNYIYDNKYLLEFNGRYDETSRFPAESRGGFFPSFSAGWRVSSERFMDGTDDWLNNLMIRASYGTLGNQLLGSRYYPYIATMGAGSTQFIFENSRSPFVNPAGLVSPTLTWETVTTQNIGVSLSAFNQRLEVDFDAYHRDTRDMLMQQTFPSLLGTSAPDANAADLRTSGWEIQINWRDRINQDWRYGLNLALADSWSEITKYENPTGALNDYYVGMRIGEIWGYETVGIFQTEEEVANHADQSAIGANWRPGDIQYRDLNGDGRITPGENTVDNPGDRRIIGNNSARYTFGINPDISYRNWSLNVFFQGLFRDYWPPASNWQSFWPHIAGHVEWYMIEDSWTEDNRDAYFPHPHIMSDVKHNAQPQTRYLQNAAYIRLKNLTLNYNIPEQLLTRMAISRAQVYFAGMNLWEYSPIHPSIDPEDIVTRTQTYYMQRTYSLGVRVTF